VFLSILLLMLVACSTPGVITEEPGADARPTDEVARPNVQPTAETTPPPSTLPTDPPAPTSPPHTPTTPAPTTVSYTVQEGDTLLGIAMEHGVPMAAVQLTSQMGSATTVHAGQVLSIPAPADWEGASPFWIVHVVQAGETLDSIGRAYDLSSEELQATNHLADANVLWAGQALVIPLDAPAVAQAPQPTATTVPPPTPTSSPRATAASTATVPPPATVPPAAPPADVADWPHETVRLINDVRAQHGLPPLIYNETLAQAAQAHANDCVQRGWCSHTGSDGSDIKTRIIRAGYDPGGWAECWAQRQSPQGAVDVWMDEVPPNDPHRRTLLTTWLTEIGVGVAETDWGYYFIADFGRP
jgi:uncharacterized protein YkwD